jgi:hypothetical protein
LEQELNGEVYNGSGDALACGSYRGVKLLEHAMKVLEKVIKESDGLRELIVCSLNLWQAEARQMLIS